MVSDCFWRHMRALDFASVSRARGFATEPVTRPAHFVSKYGRKAI